MPGGDPSESILGKRRRADTEKSDAPAEARTSEDLVKDERIWFEDGNIVIRVGPGITEKSGPIYGFKCHRSVLSDNSEVFKDMFHLPNPTNMDTVDGVPFVDLTDEQGGVRDVLRTIYGPA